MDRSLGGWVEVGVTARLMLSGSKKQSEDSSDPSTSLAPGPQEAGGRRPDAKGRRGQA